jgi:hypothetical protein
MLPEGIHYLLSHDTTIKGIVGSPRSDGTSGIFPVLAPREVTVPYIVFSQITAFPNITLEGNNQYQEARYRFRCYAADYKTAKRLAEALKLLLGGLLATLQDGTEVQGIWLVLEADTVEAMLRGTIFGVHVDFMIHFVDQTISP